jgi:hypothetical protein
MAVPPKLAGQVMSHAGVGGTAALVQHTLEICTFDILPVFLITCDRSGDKARLFSPRKEKERTDRHTKAMTNEKKNNLEN